MKEYIPRMGIEIAEGIYRQLFQRIGKGSSVKCVFCIGIGFKFIFAAQHTHQETGDAGDRSEEYSECNQVEVNGLL